jgi:glycogen synthase
MCNAFVWFMRETEEYMRCHFDIVHGHDWLTCKAIVQMNQVFSRLLTYADVCCRMLTYADVC